VSSDSCHEDLLRLHREIEEQRRGAVNLLVMGEMASLLAHEINNPLASIMLSANRLSRLVKGNDKAEPLAEHLCTAIKTLGEVVTRLTGSFGHPRMQPTPISVNDVLDEALYLVSLRAAGQGVQVVRDLGERMPQVLADAGFLKRAFLNVLTNALDAMPSGGRLGVASRLSKDRQIEVVVTDSGPGLAPEIVDRLFKPFVTTKDNAMGLGLSVVRRIMEMHRGSALLQPGNAGGVEAVLSLPVADEGKA
jgi:signal transduction histidine kinase